MGVLTRDDLKVLSARLDILARQIDEYAAARAVAAEPVTTSVPAAQVTQPAIRRPRQRKITTS